MDILGLIREWAEIRQDRKDHCKSCDILQEQLVRALAREQSLIAIVTRVPEAAPVTTIQNFEPIKSKTVPWHIKRQLLEAEDRAKAQAMREAAASTPSQNSEISIGELEKELGIGEEHAR